MKILQPQEIFTNLKNNMKTQLKTAFCSTFIIGLLTHIVIMTGDIPNHDGLASMYYDQNMIGSGRWFLTVVCGISSYFTIPWIIGLLSIFYLSLTAMVLVELFDIKHNISALLIGGLLATFPALVSTFAYMFTADGYMFALFLACLGVLLTKKYSWGFLPGGLCLAFSMGCYQAYISFCMLLCVYQVIRICLKKEKTEVAKAEYANTKVKETEVEKTVYLGIKEKALQILKYPAMGILGVSVYYVIQVILQKIQNVTLNDYQGINTVSTGISESFLQKAGRIYHDFFAFTLSGNVVCNNIWSYLAYGILGTGVLAVLIILIVKKKLYKSIWFYIITVALIVAVPILCNAILIISPNVTYHLIMRYQWILIAILAIAFTEEYTNGKVAPFISWIMLISSVIIIFNYAVTDNIAYSNIEKKYEKTYAYCLRLVDRMEQTEGYYQGIEVAMVGVVSDVQYPDTDLSFKVTSNIIGASGTSLLYTGRNYQSFLKNYMNVTISLADDATIDSIYKTDEYKEMDSFPGKNSMKVMDGILVIKTENKEN